MSLPYRSLCGSVLLALAALSAHAQTVVINAPSAPPPVQAFFGSSPFGGASLSPEGDYLAVRAGAPNRRDYLIVIDLKANTGKVVAEYGDADIDEFRWVNNERLVFNLRDKGMGPGDTRFAPGLYAVNRDGGTLVQLVERTGGGIVRGDFSARKLLPWNTFLLGERGSQDSEYIYLARPEIAQTEKVRHVSLLRVNTLTGQTEVVPRPATVQGWMLDNKGEPRLASGTEKNLTTLYYRDPANSEWRKLTSFNPYGLGKGAISPVGFGPDGSLYVVTRSDDEDTSSVHLFDLKTGKVNPQPVIVTKGYDFSGSLATNHGKLLGLRFTTDATSDEWFDPGMKAIQDNVDKLLPTTNNLLSVPSHAKTPWILVRAYSDAVPAIYFLYNKDTKQLNKVGESRPGINPAQMGRQLAYTFKSRDGMEIPALLTLPPGQKKNVPMVVLVHGGPWVRGTTWGWNPMTQFLATRGYAVLEPEFRGAKGMGAKLFTAGWKQWGLKMQDDVADATRDAISKGYADPQRICIAGASYGGYATLMGLVKDPDLYKCGIEWVGVTDVNLMYNGSWNYKSDMTDEWKQYGMPELIGDQVKDAAQLKATSPIENASKITQPLLMGYGGVDVRVPMYHGKQFYDAVTRTNKDVEWIEYPDEGHGWHQPNNNYDWWTRVEKFLNRTIGSSAQKQL
jgi:dipeptidyl aminopeptidase/acylaminoacyl peptidase